MRRAMTIRSAWRIKGHASYGAPCERSQIETRRGSSTALVLYRLPQGRLVPGSLHQGVDSSLFASPAQMHVASSPFRTLSNSDHSPAGIPVGDATSLWFSPCCMASATCFLLAYAQGWAVAHSVQESIFSPIGGKSAWHVLTICF